MHRRPRIPWLPTLVCLAALCRAGIAEAYCRTTTCLNTCPQDENGCVAGGQPLSWPQSCVSFTLHHAGSPAHGISADSALGLVEQAFERWRATDCGGGATPAIELAPSAGPAVCGRPDYDAHAGNANVWMFRDSGWPYAENALAVTVLTFDDESGAILDADVELNSSRELTLGDDQVGYDLESIVQHEAGHFLGLSHSPVQNATMWRRINRGSTDKRTLDADDVAAICAAYALGRATTSSCDFTPRNGFSAECSSEAGCRAARGTSTGGALWLGFTLLALARLRQRDRR